MPAHWTGVNEVVNPDNTLAADALVIASRALNLQVCVLFQTDIARVPACPLLLLPRMEQWYSAAGDQQPLWCEHTGKLVPEAAAADVVGHDHWSSQSA